MQPQHTMFTDRAIARFWSNVLMPTDPAGCWLWQRARHERGYGLVTIAGAMRRANRVAWEIANERPVPTGLWVLHRCNNPPCVRPDHLYVGTAQDNADDRTRAGHTLRGDDHDSRLHPERRPRGERQWKALLSESDVRAIRARYVKKYGVGATLAREYGVSISTIFAVVLGKSWRHIL